MLISFFKFSLLPLFVAVWLIYDFYSFQQIYKNYPPVNISQCDALVVLTGDKKRITAALLAAPKTKHKRLLVSGIDHNIMPEKMKKNMRRLISKKKIGNIKIDLGYLSYDTQTNAEETLKWVEKHGYRKIGLVTSSLHMPRSLYIFDTTFPKHINLKPVPVLYSENWNLLWQLREYTKFKVVKLYYFLKA